MGTPLMNTIILMNADDPYSIEVLQNSMGENKLFRSADDAMDWLENNAKNGWCTRIVELD